MDISTAIHETTDLNAIKGGACLRIEHSILTRYESLSRKQWFVLGSPSKTKVELILDMSLVLSTRSKSLSDECQYSGTRMR
ncbi:hypothetical protein BDZ89DRAFT_1061269 [Hymenopellis radicata]|nr:hypothetical protein BDZ89DRAFT_1061269 [Hymenopellis radicata]